jgi:GNAT superfamily N-acetyltransferase
MNFHEIDVKTIYLEYNAPFRKKKISNTEDCQIFEVKNIDTEFYLFLFRRIGSSYGWTGRLLMQEEELKMKITASETSIFVLYENGIPQGFAELLIEKATKSAEIVYFGLISSCHGKGYASLLMNAVFEKADAFEINRLWLHTCEKDSERALPFYIKSGFRVFDERNEKSFYPSA